MGVMMIMTLALMLWNGKHFARTQGNSTDCNGEMTVSKSVIRQFRSVRVALQIADNSYYRYGYTAMWQIFVYNSPNNDVTWINTYDYPDEYKSFHNESVYSLTILNVTWIKFDVRINLMRSNSPVCFKDKQIETSDCNGEMTVSKSVILQFRSVSVALQITDNSYYRYGYTAKWQIFVYNSPNNDVTWINTYDYPDEYKFFNNESVYSLTILNVTWIKFDVRINLMRSNSPVCFKDKQIETSERPAKPKLIDVNIRYQGCLKGCIVVDSDHVTIRCKVSGGTEPVNVTFFINSIPYTAQLTTNQYGQSDLYQTTKWKTEVQHKSEVRCEAMNPALDVPLVTTAHIYKFVKANTTSLTNNNIAENKPDIIRCVSEGMRPPTNMSIQIKNSPCPSRQSVVHDNNSDTFRVFADCPVTLSRLFHGAHVRCCPDESDLHGCDTKRLNILYPPTTVKAVQINSTDKTTLNKKIISCSVSHSNPSCTVNWTIPEEIPDYRQQTINRSRYSRSNDLTVISKLHLNVTRHNNGLQVMCTAVCWDFKVKSNIVTLNIRAPPLIEVSPGTNVTRRQGESLTLKCTVDSNSKSQISWRHGDTILFNATHCNESLCYHVEHLLQSDTGMYICEANNEFDTTSKSVYIDLTVVGNESTASGVKGIMKQSWFIPVVAGIPAVILVTCIVLVIVKKRKTSDKSVNRAVQQPEREAVQEEDGTDYVINRMYASVESPGRSDNVICVEKMSGKENSANKGGMESGNQPSTSDNNPLPTDQTYASVLPKELRQNASTIKKAPNSSDKHELVYLDLQFPKNIESSSRESKVVNMDKTEYITVDFKKTEQLSLDTENTQ